MSVTYSRSELKAILATRHGQSEMQGADAVLEFRIRITPELLEQLIGVEIHYPDGHIAIFDGVVVDGDYAEPILRRLNIHV